MKIPSCSWNCEGQLIIVLINSRSACNFLNLKTKTCSTPFNPTKSNSLEIATKSLTVNNFKLTSLLKIPDINFVKIPAETILADC